MTTQIIVPSDDVDNVCFSLEMLSPDTVALVGFRSSQWTQCVRLQGPPLLVTGTAGTIVQMPGCIIRRVLASGSTKGILLERRR